MATTPEFSRPISIEGIIPDKTRSETVEATAAECAALAQRFDIRELSGLKAKVEIRRVAGNAAIRVSGKFRAEVVQACVVSLQDVFGRVEGAFDTYFTESKPTGKEVVFAAEDDFEAAEMVQNGHIDLGEVVAQYLALELEPYPRAPGVSLPAQVTVGDDGDKDKKHNPFKVLEGLKK